MAWIGAVAAAAACHNNGRRRKKPSMLLLVVTVFTLVIGVFLPLILIIPDSSSILIPIIFMFIIMIGILALVAAGFSDQYDENAVDYSGRHSRNSDRPKQRPTKTYYQKDDPREDFYWGSEPKSTAFFCMNCGMRLESDDRFCASCGWRVN